MSLELIQQAMQEIKDTESFDATRYAYLQGLYERVQLPSHSNNKVLLEKLSVTLQQYQQDYQQAKQQAEELLLEIVGIFPDAQSNAEALVRENNFRELKRFYQRLLEKQKQQEHVKSLSELLSALNRDQLDKVNLPSSLDEVLLQQELNARKKAGLSSALENTQTQRPQLQSMKGIRESMKYFNLDRMIIDAIEKEPENAGPHNPHMLAIKSLIKMKDLSPQYLRRFAGYIETVLWLEKNAVKLNRKKAP